MALTPAQLTEMGIRRVQRVFIESAFINTLNLADRIELNFVWYPGADDVNVSLIDVILPLPTPAAAPREIPFRWSRSGMADIKRSMAIGRITLPLAPGKSGVLTVFDTQWRITRAALGVALNPVGSLRGIQQRLNILGYHLRAPGVAAAGIDGINGARTERAVLSLQVDYRRPAGAPAAAPAGPLLLRGEAIANPGIQANLDFYNGLTPPPSANNPSAADSAKAQAALVAIVGT
jgi:hypothetical protein